MVRRAASSAKEALETEAAISVKSVTRKPTSIEDDPTAGYASTAVGEAVPAEAAKPSMADVFGPGGLLERCMIGGYEHRRA